MFFRGSDKCLCWVMPFILNQKPTDYISMERTSLYEKNYISSVFLSPFLEFFFYIFSFSPLIDYKDHLRSSKRGKIRKPLIIYSCKKSIISSMSDRIRTGEKIIITLTVFLLEQCSFPR